VPDLKFRRHVDYGHVPWFWKKGNSPDCPQDAGVSLADSGQAELKVGRPRNLVIADALVKVPSESNLPTFVMVPGPRATP